VTRLITWMQNSNNFSIVNIPIFKSQLGKKFLTPKVSEICDRILGTLLNMQAVIGPITEINQSNCSIAGPIFSKYRTGHCPEWSRTCVFAFFSRVIHLLLTKLARDRTGRISALGLFLYGPRCARSVLSRPRADIPPVRPSRLVN